MSVALHCADVLEWAAGYDGPPFHALLCDPPYHLTNRTPDVKACESCGRVLGGRDGAPAECPRCGGKLTNQRSQGGRGFMGQQWDGGDTAHRPDTWATLASILQPGAFVVAFAGSRGYHRQLCAMEDAGLVVHPSIFNASSGASVEVPSLLGWGFGSGFPKATRVDAEGFDGHRYGRQALKPALEPILVAQVPYRGAARTCIAATGAGAWHIDAGRLGGAPLRWAHPRGLGYGSGGRDEGPCEALVNPAGRWPANLVLTHHPACECVGERQVAGQAPTEVARRGGESRCRAGGDFVPRVTVDGYADADGLETVADWRCHPDCPARKLGEQSGTTFSRAAVYRHAARENVAKGAERARVSTGHEDAGTAARFFFQADWQLEVAEALAAADPVRYVAKASRAEREAGLEGFAPQCVGDGRDTPIDNAYQRGETARRNVHPTVKPIALARWLAALLLPPAHYAPRRIFVPFAGVCSEAIACGLAGWEEVIAVEREADYAAIGEARCRWHLAQPGLPFGGAE